MAILRRAPHAQAVVAHRGIARSAAMYDTLADGARAQGPHPRRLVAGLNPRGLRTPRRG